MNDLLTRLEAHGLSLSLKEGGKALAYEYNDEVFDALPEATVNKLYDLIDQNEAKLIDYLNKTNILIFEKLAATTELAQLLIGNEVTLPMAKVIDISELSVTFEASLLRWQMPLYGAVVEFKKGQVYEIVGVIDAFIISSRSTPYINLFASSVKLLGEEAF